MASPQAIPEPMNSQPHHSKVKVSMTLVDPTFAAGMHVGGRLEMECRADKGLGIGIMMVELFAIQELSSRDHSATSTFLHSRRLFQGPTLPPSNAVQANPIPGDPSLPQHYYQARRGHSTFLFRIPIPATSPSSISFGSGLAKVRYELRASVGVFWKNEKRLVVDKRPIDVVEAYPYDDAFMGKVPEATVVGENGKLWMQGKLVGNMIIAGESACLELQVKNHSAKKNTGLTLALKRTLYLPDSASGTQRSTPIHLSDTLITVPFRGAEYIIPPGAEGVANLVFDVPKDARGVRGGTLDGEEPEGGNGVRRTDSLFEIRCTVEVKLAMGMGSKDILLEIPVEVVHPITIPSPKDILGPFSQPYLSSEPVSGPTYNPYYVPLPPVSPGPLHMPYIDPIYNQVWLPPMIPTHTPIGYPYLSHSPAPPDPYQSPLQSYGAPQTFYGSPHILGAPYQNLMPPDPEAVHGGYLQRPSSAGPVVSASQMPPPVIQGLPGHSLSPYLLPLPQQGHQFEDLVSEEVYEPQEGKGERALRVSRHLRMLSRNRSVSPQSHRYPLPKPSVAAVEAYTQDLLPLSGVAGPSFTSGAIVQNAILLPPVLTPSHSMPPSTPEAKLVHSPRPQLTPKHSFTRDPVLGTSSKSERVEELEMMADAVDRRSRDLSCDLPKEMPDILSAAISANVEAEEQQEGPSTPIPDSNMDVNVNKTLPGPPVPSGKPLLVLPSRARADRYFPDQPDATAPLPSDQTPPTPALHAVLPSRQRADRDRTQGAPKTESGLDALERRLLAEVGTRKVDTRPAHNDVRSVLPIDTSVASSSSAVGAGAGARPTPAAPIPIPIPSKSPEPLHDSAISSLTLAGGMGGDDSDGEFDGRTHRAGRSHAGSSAGRGDARGGLHMHMRDRAQGGTPPRVERAREVQNENEKVKVKEGKTSGKKKDRVHTKTSAKGRVAAWLGGIDPDVPPQEQVIPPSPSVLRDPRGTFEEDGDMDEEFIQKFYNDTVDDSRVGSSSEIELVKDAPASPNPRSSGFVPISTFKRNSIQGPPLLLRDSSVTAEAQRIQDIWSSGSPPAVYALPNALFAITSRAPPTSIRTDRRVSPPSAKPLANIVPMREHPAPMSYSAAARSKPKTPEPARVQAKSPPPPPLPTKSPAQAPGGARVHAMFPPVKPVDLGPKYDIRSARGGRGGKVTAVANLWASGAIAGDVNGKTGEVGTSVQRSNSGVRVLPHAESSANPPVPPKPARKLFSAAVLTPVPAPVANQHQPLPSKQLHQVVPVPCPPALLKVSGNGAAHVPPPSRTRTEAQKRPDSRALFTPAAKRSPRTSPGPSPRKAMSSNALSTPSSGAPVVHATRVQPRPATAMATPFALRGNTPTNANTNGNGNGHGKVPSPALPRGLVAPIVKGASDPAVVSSSHAVPTLSTSASLARPRAVRGGGTSQSAREAPVAAVGSGVEGVAAPLAAVGLAPLATKVLAENTTAELEDAERPTSPGKPVDLAFGQARLRDLIKKYQGAGQK